MAFTSLVVPLAACLLAIPLGAAVAFATWRASPVLRVAVSSVCIMVLLAVVPWSPAEMPAAFTPATLRLLALALAIVVLILMPRLEKLDPLLLDAANASGAAPVTRFRLVILPWMALPALAAFALCLAVSMSGVAAHAIRQVIAG